MVLAQSHSIICYRLNCQLTSITIDHRFHWLQTPVVSVGRGGGARKNCRGRYVIYWGGGLGLQREGSSMKFWSNGGGSRLLNLWKSGEGHAFTYRKHKIYQISNAFSAIQGAQISKFPGGACPRTPLPSQYFHVHISSISFMKHASLTPWFTTCTFSTVNSWRIFPNWYRILC